MAGDIEPRSPGAIAEDTRRNQAAAADPAASVWVRANAGTGKTHVLTMRVLRLLLAGTAPDKILCLTYTKAAAAEMSSRVFARLAEWVTMADEPLGVALAEITGRSVTAAEKADARKLFAAAIETPGGLKVQTIHAFCERLLQRFPLEAGVTPGFKILDDDLAETLRREAIDAVLASAAGRAGTPLARAVRTAIAYAADDRFDEIVAAALAERDWHALPATEDTRRSYCKVLGVPEDGCLDALDRETANVLAEASLKALHDILAAGSAKDMEVAGHLAAAAAASSPSRRAEALRAAFITKGGTPRKTLMTRGTAAANPGFEDTLRVAQDRLLELEQTKAGLKLVEATMALLTIVASVVEIYANAKARRAALDYDDLIEKTCTLLRTAESADWVLFKLDSGLDHILVDESQDTSPDQWQVITALAAEFFSGSGARETARTLFAVGDEKQSIYSFQGAAPEMFAEQGAHFQRLARDGGAEWRPISLNQSFRSVEPVLSAVDRIFCATPGLPGVGRAAHAVKRAGHAGLVELWPAEAHEDGARADAWSAANEDVGAVPSVRLAARIAATIRHWLDSNEVLASEGRPVTAGDILILVRKRNPFAAPMVAALKAQSIPVAGSDRIRLTEQIAVEDLLSLGDFLTLPEDDLSLAEVLKSPIFNFSDDDLLAIAPGRKGSLWSALLANTALAPHYEDAAATLKRWRKAADFTPPFEFFAALLDRDGVRAKLLARLGPDAADPIDEFLNLALSYDDGAPPSLPRFLHWLRSGTREIKRDMEHGRNEVRVMTVHGAKGLEAPIVFLPDTCTAGSSGRRGGRLIRLVPHALFPGRRGALVWPVKETGGHRAVAAAKAAIAASEGEESNRLLYVAMTRARDRLYVAGFENKRGRETGCWYDVMAERLNGFLQKEVDLAGRPVHRRAASQSTAAEPRRRDLSFDHGLAPLPEWAKRPAPREPQIALPLAPSRLVPYEIDEAGDPVPTEPPKERLSEPPPFTPGAVGGDARFLRGTLTHALLEHLPLIERGQWARAAKAFVAERGRGLPARVRTSIVTEALAILDDRAFAPIFGRESRAEVPIAAIVPRPHGSGPPLRLTGQIDRLAVLGDEVLIVDYKTNRLAPNAAADVAPVYLFQLAAYRLAVGQIYPGKRVRAALLWTDGPKIMEIPAALLDAHASLLWDMGSLPRENSA